MPNEAQKQASERIVESIRALIDTKILKNIPAAFKLRKSYDDHNVRNDAPHYIIHNIVRY